MRPADETELPPPFADLRDQLRQAAAREIEVERRVAERSRRSRRRVVAAVAIGLAVPAAGVAAAGRILSQDSAPVADPNAPAAGAGIVPSSAFPDPEGGPPWALKVFANRKGEECVAFGRLQGGELGRYSGRVFTPLPERSPGICGDPDADSVIFATGDSRFPPRTVVFGLSQAREPVTFEARGRRHELRPGALGTFLLVLEGTLPAESATVRWREGDRAVVRRVP